ncbi:MAG: DUF3460 family protein [Candidatus Accumulibacter sp.]|jgi:hypothetical protein|nr:DUF3460 family protein [Accumulibacter sp.]
MAIYQSEYEKFREEMRALHPDWESGQREGLALLWNKRGDVDELRSRRAAEEKRKAYPYDVNF